MAKTIASVAMTQPLADPNINEGGNFDMGGQVTTALHGAMDYDMHWEWDQGLGDSDANYVDIPSGSGDLYHNGTNPAVNLAVDTEQVLNILGGAEGDYFVRVSTIDHNDTEAEDISSTQAVTVSASGFQAAWAGPNSKLGV